MADFEIRNLGAGEYRLSGELSFGTASEALRATGRLFEAGTPLRFDLAGIGRADSAGVALLIEWVRQARGAGGEIRFSHMPASLLAIIRVSGAEVLLPIDPAATQD